MEKYPVTIGLHGFWGQPEDWNQVQDYFPHLFVAKDLYENKALLDLPLPQAAKEWGLFYQKKYPDGVILAGYSMGGRFALHMARLFPLWVKGLALLSVHPGGLNEEERKMRQQWITSWKKKFTSLTLQECMELWHQQDAFTKTRATDFRRDLSGSILAQNLENWSLLHHEVVLDNLDQLNTPQIWLFGQEDVKFQKIAKSLQAMWPRQKVVNVAKAGHRLLLDAPKEVAEALKELVQASLERGKENEIAIH